MTQQQRRQVILAGAVAGALLTVISGLRIVLILFPGSTWAQNAGSFVELTLPVFLIVIVSAILTTRAQVGSAGAVFGAVAGAVEGALQSILSIAIMAFWPGSYLYESYVLPLRLGPGTPTFTDLVVGAAPCMLAMTLFLGVIGATIGTISGMLALAVANARRQRTV